LLSDSLGQYFYSDDPSEIALLDAGAPISGWARTGDSFDVAISTASNPLVDAVYLIAQQIL